ncbi:hypothetical protein BGZ65_003359, partial [Modicella reniformis]
MTSSSPILFSNKWLMKASAEDLITNLGKMPKLVSTAKAEFLSLNKTHRLSSIIVVSEEQVPSLPEIPSARNLQRILFDMNCKEGAYLVNIPNIGIVEPGAVRVMNQIRLTREFAESLLKSEIWLSLRRNGEDKFYEWLWRCFTTERNIYLKVFTPAFCPELDFRIDSILNLCREDECLDVEVLSGIMAFFRRCYGQERRNLFLDPLYIYDEATMNSAKKHIKNGQAKMLFAFVHMNDHWGAVRLDLAKHEISFGDSFWEPCPLDQIDAIVEEIRPSRGDKAKWNHAKKNISRLNVPENRDPGSCGILAAIAIERAVNEHFKWDDNTTYISVAYQRRRFLSLLTRHTPAEEDEFATAYWEEVPEARHYETEEEHMAKYLASMYKEYVLGEESNSRVNDAAKADLEEE